MLEKVMRSGVYTAGRPVARGDQTRPTVDWMLSIKGPGCRPDCNTMLKIKSIPKSVKKMLGDQIFCWAPRFFNLVVRVGNQILKRVYSPVKP